MKVKKLLALCMSVAVTATAATTVMPVMAETSTQTNSTVLFSDDFEAYPNNANGDLPLYYGDGKSMGSTYKTDYFKYTTSAGVNYVAQYEDMITQGSLAKHIQFLENKGVGSGKAMTVTSQGFIDYAGIIKQSNITANKIADKALTFSIDFKINRMYFGEGYGVYLANYDSSSNKIVPEHKEDAYMDVLKSVDTNKQLLVVTPERKDGKPQIFAFGQNIGEVETGKAYTYTLKLTPDGNGGYTAAAYIDGTALKNIAADKLPKVNVISSFEYVMMSPIVHRSTIKNNAGVTKYENDIEIISVDNLMMTATVIDNSMLFSDDFEGYPYSTNDDGLPLWYGAKENGTIAATYDNDYFKYHTGYAIDTRENVVSAYEGWMTNGSLAKHIQFIENAGVGTGKAMNITSQGFLNWSGILKQSNITSEKINNKELVFSIDFKVDRMYYGEGYGIYFSEYNSSKDEFSPYQKEDAWPDILFGANKTDANKQLLLIAPDKKDGAPQIFAFGVKVGETDSAKAHNYTLRLVPDANNSYRVYASLDGTNLGEVNSSDIPSVTTLANFKYIMMSPVAHKSTIRYNAGVTSYENDKSIVSLDNLMMRAVEPVNMEGASVNGYATMSGNDGSKTVTVKINPLSGKTITPYVIVAVYNPETGELKSAKLWEGNGGTSISTETTATVAEIAATSTDKVSVFMWNGFTDVIPLTNSVEF